MTTRPAASMVMVMAFATIMYRNAGELREPERAWAHLTRRSQMAKSATFAVLAGGRFCPACR